MNQNQDIIVAVATASGYSGIGIIRISGDNLLSMAKDISHKDSIKPRYSLYSNFYDANSDIIDTGLLLYFPSPKARG